MNNEIGYYRVDGHIGSHINKCYGVTKDPKENDYLLVFEYASYGDLHNNLLKNFKEITWENKIDSLWNISLG